MNRVGILIAKFVNVFEHVKYSIYVYNMGVCIYS